MSSLMNIYTSAHGCAAFHCTVATAADTMIVGSLHTSLKLLQAQDQGGPLQLPAQCANPSDIFNLLGCLSPLFYVIGDGG